jgi:hypothetical protein
MPDDVRFNYDQISEPASPPGFDSYAADIRERVLRHVRDVVEKGLRADDGAVIDTLAKPDAETIGIFARFKKLFPIEYAEQLQMLADTTAATRTKKFSASLFDMRIDKAASALPDLHDEFKLSSEQTAKKVEAEAKARATRIIVHGRFGHDYYYSSTASPDLLKLAPSEHSQNYYLSLAPLEYWEREFGEKKADGYTLKWTRVTSSLMDQARTKIDFDPDAYRGRGAWLEETETGEKRFVYNTGRHLLVDGAQVEIHDHVSKHVYSAGLTINVAAAEDALDEFARRALIQRILSFPWVESHHGWLVVGWLLMSTISGGLNWRCLLWVTAGAGAGKSYLLEHVMAKLLRSACRFFNGSSTDKGIASAMGNDALVFLFDESEVADERSKERMQVMLRALRAPASASKGSRAVSSSGGQARTSRMNSVGAFGSINDCVREEADEQRFLMPKLQSPNKNPDGSVTETILALQKETQEYSDKTLTPAFSAKFIAFGVHNFDRIRNVIERFSVVLSRQLGNRRFGLHYGTALGCAYFFEHARDDISDEEIAGWLASKEIGERTLIDHETQRTAKDQIVETLLHAKIEIIDGANQQRRHSIGDLLEAAFFPGALGDRISVERAAEVLLAHGIRIDRAGGRVRFARNHLKLEKIFAATPFDKNALDMLRELTEEDDKPYRKSAHFPGSGTRACVAVKYRRLTGRTVEQMEVAQQEAEKTLARDLFARIMTSKIRVDVGENRTNDFPVVVAIAAYINAGDNTRNISQMNAKCALGDVGIAYDTDNKEVILAVGHPQVERLAGRGFDANRSYDAVLSAFVTRRSRSAFGGGMFDTIAIPRAAFGPVAAGAASSADDAAAAGVASPTDDAIPF